MDDKQKPTKINKVTTKDENVVRTRSTDRDELRSDSDKEASLDLCCTLTKFEIGQLGVLARV